MVRAAFLVSQLLSFVSINYVEASLTGTLII